MATTSTKTLHNLHRVKKTPKKPASRKHALHLNLRLDLGHRCRQPSPRVRRWTRETSEHLRNQQSLQHPTRLWSSRLDLLQLGLGPLNGHHPEDCTNARNVNDFDQLPWSRHPPNKTSRTTTVLHYTGPCAGGSDAAAPAPEGKRDEESLEKRQAADGLSGLGAGAISAGCRCLSLAPRTVTSTSTPAAKVRSLGHTYN
jgi:hypothetical protein